jgi:lipopolysaccharide heptosyltransferase II
MKNKNENIVIFRTDRIGEVLLSTVVVEALKKHSPDDAISFITSEYSKPMLEGRRDIENILTVDTFSKKKCVFRAIKLARILRRYQFDMAIILNPHKMLHLACFLAGIPTRLGYDRKWGFLLTKKMVDERNDGNKHETEYAMDLLKEIGLNVPTPKPKLFVDSKAEIIVDDFIKEYNLESEKRPLVVMHPGSSNSAKIWPEKRYIELVKALKAAANCCIVMVGDANDREFAGKVIEQTGINVFNTSGMFDLKELIAFLRRADLYIGSDTGPMHMAAAVGVPVIAIFGRKIPGVSPKRWGPCGEGHVILHKPCKSGVCDDTICEYGYKCLENITAEEVCEAALKILADR